MDAAAYASRETYPQVAGSTALDLVNTVSWRLSPERRIEHFVEYADVLRWAVQLGLLDEKSSAELLRIAETDAAAAADELSRVLTLREAFYDAAYDGASSEPVAREHAAAAAAGRLERDRDGWTWAFPVDLALPRRRIALAAVDLLLRDDLDRLGQCSDAECGWVFLDTSPRHNRRWCVASDCGNRNRVREHYARVRDAASGASADTSVTP
ncbi:CGNR zinc finger domain-containing protein [Agromyces humatus]|uniref:CGNR zinc finger domain-containing protein n=1 Tax=Agromyces humatus TaxID=279573 RepID=A0ABP4WDI5_9MICO|nr:CGNR zinc finger domain-containing protein [Agromyces humatus]